MREDLTRAIKERDEPKKNILKVVIADIERINPAQLNDDKCDAVISKTYEGMLQLSQFMEKSADKRISGLRVELSILSLYLPKSLTKENIMAELEKMRDNFVSVPDGQCMKMAMERFKSLGVKVDGKLVKQCIDEIRR